MKVGFFGGSFDPIHFGHLALAIAILEKGLVDRILFCPARCSPFKTGTPPKADDSLRAKMIEAAIQDIPQFELYREELSRPAPSYTIDAIRHLIQQGKQSIRLILSSEAASHLHEWKEEEELLRLAPPLIGQTGEISGPFKRRLEPYLVEIPRFDISSTEIRARIKKSLYIGHLVPKSVLEIIVAHRLYS